MKGCGGQGQYSSGGGIVVKSDILRAASVTHYLLPVLSIPCVTGTFITLLHFCYSPVKSWLLLGPFLNEALRSRGAAATLK